MKDLNKILDNCISCQSKPCQTGCPLQNDTTGFIKLIKNKKYKESYELLCKTTVLQSICGRICPHTKQCQGKCIKRISYSAVEIGKLEAYIGDMAIKEGWNIPKFTEIKNEKKIAVIGGGPAGLTCAAFLARYGFNVTIYEKYNFLGGILEHSIPDFRLEKNVLKNCINQILKLGINVEYNKQLGKNLNLNELEEEYDAIFLGFGANKSIKMNIDGENLDGVYGGNELLENKIYPDFKNKEVFVIGGGNVAMDTCRMIKTLGAKRVTVVYRRSENEMPAEKNEIKSAKEDGVDFLFQTNILKILGNKKVEEIECIKTRLVEKEGCSRKIPINIEKSNFVLKADYVVMAVGSKADDDLIKQLHIDTTKNGAINIDDNYRTSRAKLFAGGELVGSNGTVAWAAESGRAAANSIKDYLIKGGE